MNSITHFKAENETRIKIFLVFMPLHLTQHSTMVRTQVIDFSGICSMDATVERQVSKHGDVFTAT